MLLIRATYTSFIQSCSLSPRLSISLELIAFVERDSKSNIKALLETYLGRDPFLLKIRLFLFNQIFQRNYFGSAFQNWERIEDLVIYLLYW